MKYDDEHVEDLHRLQARVDAKLEQVRDMVGSDLADAAPENLQRLVQARLGQLGPVERTAMQIKAAVAHAQLNTLLAEMNRHLDVIASEMRQTTQFSRAAAAYGQTRTR